MDANLQEQPSIDTGIEIPTWEHGIGFLRKHLTDRADHAGAGQMANFEPRLLKGAAAHFMKNTTADRGFFEEPVEVGFSHCAGFFGEDVFSGAQATDGLGALGIAAGRAEGDQINGIIGQQLVEARSDLDFRRPSRDLLLRKSSEGDGFGAFVIFQLPEDLMAIRTVETDAEFVSRRVHWGLSGNPKCGLLGDGCGVSLDLEDNGGGDSAREQVGQIVKEEAVSVLLEADGLSRVKEPRREHPVF